MPNRERIQIDARTDQLHAAIKDRLADVARIGIWGPDGSERDAKLVKLVFSFMTAQLILSYEDSGECRDT